MCRSVRVFSCLLLLGFAAAVFSDRIEAAPSYRYCAQYKERGDVTCAYDTFAQCLATAGGGAGGFCVENPDYRPPAPPQGKRRPG